MFFSYKNWSLKKNQLFCSIADDWVWFDTWRGISEIEPKDRPISLEYGDNTQLSYEDKKIFSESYDKNGNILTSIKRTNINDRT